MRVASTPPSASVSLISHRYGHDRLWGRTYLAVTVGLLLALSEALWPAGLLIAGGVAASARAYRRSVDRLAQEPSTLRVDLADLWHVIHTQVVGGALAIAGMILLVQLLELL
ncbi:MAG: hypothetical protein IPK37_00620 [Austwickia sp.]|jgi:hypothetical protein|nr:MAG: hypothetical protein IPK37_00620 [Austwickia sp.]